MRHLTPTLLLALTACGPGEPPPSGTSVGNPGKQVVRVADPDPSIGIEAAVAEYLAIAFIPCTDELVDVLDETDVDLLDGTQTEVPGGRQCGLALTFDAPVHLEGSGTGPEMPTYNGRLDPGIITLWAEQVIDVDEHTFVLELAGPGWLDAEALGLTPDTPVEFAPESELAGVLADQVATDSALYADPDDDGVLSADERAAGPLASPLFGPPDGLGDTGEPADDQDRLSSEGCNCETSAAPPGGLLVLLLLAVTRRNYSAPR